MSLLARQSKVPYPSEERTVPPPNHQELNAVLGRGSTFEGKLAFEGTVHINGTFIGDIHSKDTLVIGEGAKVQGEIDVGTLIINGDVSGTIRARSHLEMHAPARVKGTVLSPSLIIDRGVIFEGTSRMENLDAPAVVSVPPPSRPAKIVG